MTENIEYFYCISEYYGERYFKVNWHKGTVIQIVLDPGKHKRGKSHCTGIYIINISSFRSTYYWYVGKKSNTQMLISTENQYNQAFERSIQFLQCY